MKQYEVTYITVNEEAANAATLSPILQENGAKIVSVFPWDGRRKLAYPINKQDQGFYTTVVFESETSAIAPIERAIQLTEGVLRALIVEFVPGLFHRTPEAPRAPKAVTKEETKEAIEPVTTEAEAPAEEEKPAEEETEEKPKAKRTRKAATQEDTKALDEKLEELLKEDITA